MRRSLRTGHAALLLLWLLFLGAATAGGQALVEPTLLEQDQVEAVIDQAQTAMAGVHDYRGELVKGEVFGDELVVQRLAFKFSRPFKVYVKYLEPYAGREGIYIRGENRNRLRAHKGSIPDVPVSLDPRGRVAMIENHHPITEFGLEHMLEVSARNIDKAIERGDATLRLTHGGLVRGEPTWRIEIASKAGGLRVKVRRGESLWEVAKRVGQDMYVILHHNEDISSPFDVTTGQKVFVPHYYAGRGHYFISKKTFMLVKAVSWDHYGKLYESYEFSSLELNPGLTDRDFDHRNKDYDFVIVNQR